MGEEGEWVLGRGVGVRVYSIGRRSTTYLLLHLIGPLVFFKDEAHTYIHTEALFLRTFFFFIYCNLLQMGWFSTQLPKSVHYCFNIF